MGKHPDTVRFFWFQPTASAPSCALNARRKISSALRISAPARRTEARASISRPIGTRRARAFDPVRGGRSRAQVRVRAGAPRGFDPERDERGRGCSCTGEVADRERGVGLGGLLDSEVEVADPKESLRWLGYACRVCADAAPRRAPAPAAPRRRRASRGAHRAAKSTRSRVHARRSCSNPRTSADARPRAPPHRARRLVAPRRAVDRSATADSPGCVAARAPPRARRTRAPFFFPSSENERRNPRRDARRAPTPSRKIPRTLAPIDALHAVTPFRVSQGEHQDEHSASSTRSACARRWCACSPGAARAAAAATG